MTINWAASYNWIYDLKPSHWWNPKTIFQVTPPNNWPLEREYVAIVLVLFFLVAILMRFLPFRQPVKERLIPFLWTNWFLGLIIFFFRYQQVPLLGMDIWRLLQDCAIVIWLLSIMVYRTKHLPKEILSEKVEAYKNKFLPKPKN